MNQEFEAWLARKPPVIQELARKYEPASGIVDEDDGFALIGYVVGYAEDGCLVLSRVDPKKEYRRAIRESFHWSPEACVICGQHTHGCGDARRAPRPALPGTPPGGAQLTTIAVGFVPVKPGSLTHTKYGPAESRNVTCPWALVGRAPATVFVPPASVVTQT